MTVVTFMKVLCLNSVILKHSILFLFFKSAYSVIKCVLFKTPCPLVVKSHGKMSLSKNTDQRII